MTIVGTFDAQPVAGDTYTIQGWGTTVDSFQLGTGQKAIELHRIHLTDQGTVNLTNPFSQLDVYYSKIADSVPAQVVVDQFSRVRMYTSAIEGIRIFVSQGYYAMYGSRHIGGQGTACVFFNQLANGFISNGTVIGANTESLDAIEINANSQVSFFSSASDGYVRVRNANQAGFFGIDVNYGSGASNASNIRYDGNDTNIDADASSWTF